MVTNVVDLAVTAKIKGEMVVVWFGFAGYDTGRAHGGGDAGRGREDVDEVVSELGDFFYHEDW